MCLFFTAEHTQDTKAKGILLYAARKHLNRRKKGDFLCERFCEFL